VTEVVLGRTEAESPVICRDLQFGLVFVFFFFQVRNEPKNIHIAAEYIAKIKGIPVEEVIEVTTQNALKVFPKLRNFLRI